MICIFSLKTAFKCPYVYSPAGVFPGSAPAKNKDLKIKKIIVVSRNNNI